MKGTVAAFDEHRGLGEVAADPVAGGGRYPFHCTAIADGSRTVTVGSAVEFRVVAGPLGTLEAAEIRTPAAPPARTPTGAG
jgi:cold shock CspA family protein